MMDAFTKFNFFEAILWFLIAGMFLLFGGKREKFAITRRKTCLFLSVMFTLFGISDLIEIHTGAWWRPVWLLLLKGICLIGITFGFVCVCRKKSNQSEGTV